MAAMLAENRELLHKVITQFITFSTRNDDSVNRPTTVAFVNRMTVRYTNKEFSKPLLDNWDEISSKLK